MKNYIDKGLRICVLDKNILEFHSNIEFLGAYLFEKKCESNSEHGKFRSGFRKKK